MPTNLAPGQTITGLAPDAAGPFAIGTLEVAARYQAKIWQNTPGWFSTSFGDYCRNALLLPDGDCNAAAVGAHGFRAAVYRAAGGTLDFAFQFTNDPNGSEGRASVNLFVFGGRSTAVGFTTAPVAGFATGQGGIVAVSRAADGSTVRFLTVPLAPGAASHVFYVRTDATGYRTGGLAQLAVGGPDDDIATPLPYGKAAGAEFIPMPA